jgi:hypothetical protein
MKSVYLDYHGRSWTITDEAFRQIAELIQANCICETCKEGYTEENPQVAQNICLVCFLLREQRHGITFLDEVGGNFRFIDPKGEIRISDIDSTESRISIAQTILYHGFPLPQSIMLDGIAKILSEWSWRIHGAIERSCMVLEYGSSYGGESYWFLAYKNGSFVELNKRKKTHRDLLQRAKNQIEASRDKQGYYHIGDRSFYGLYDTTIYEVLAEIASIEFDISGKVLE